jgi:hypothetical protein
VLSHDQFALDLREMFTQTRESGSVICRVDAVWFRRRKRVLQACAGSLRAWFGPNYADGREPLDAAQFAQMADRRNAWASADCQARWDGETFWAQPPMHPDFQRGYLELLEPMLAGFPAVPHGYDGWWRFTDVF